MKLLLTGFILCAHFSHSVPVEKFGHRVATAPIAPTFHNSAAAARAIHASA